MVFILKGATLALHFYLYQFKLFNISEILPIWVLWILTFVMIDFVFYFYHRISHRVNFLWAIHMSHHSSEEMNFAVSFRQAWFGSKPSLPERYCKVHFLAWMMTHMYRPEKINSVRNSMIKIKYEINHYKSKNP